jgi:DNA-binding transcriptional LysR family regulator
MHAQIQHAVSPRDHPEKPMRNSLLPIVLRYVDQVARSGSIQGAAKELHIAASAVNRQILQLEEELGVALFERLPRGMRLTPPGATIVTLARRWRSDEQRAGREIRQMQGINQGKVRIVAMDSHATSVLPLLIEDLSAKHPLVSLEIEIAGSDDAVAALLGDRADLAAVFNLTPRRDLHTLWQSDLPFGCIVAPGHPLTTTASASMQQACAYPIALQSKKLLIRRYLESHYSWLFAEARTRVETNSLHLVKTLVQSGKYVAFTSELDAAPELLAGTLCFLPIRDAGVEPQSISLVIDAGRPLSPLVKIVGELLADIVRRRLDQVRALASRDR